MTTVGDDGRFMTADELIAELADPVKRADWERRVAAAWAAMKYAEDQAFAAGVALGQQQAARPSRHLRAVP